MMRRGEGHWGRGARHEPPPADDAPAWIRGALPDGWFTGAPEITIDRDEILIVGTLAALMSEPSAPTLDQAIQILRNAAPGGPSQTPIGEVFPVT